MTILAGLDIVLGALRNGFFAAAAVLAVICAVDWLVRTRKIDPFGPIARFMRANVHPMMAPVERRVVRAGGLPSSAPWWTLVFVVVAGIVLISLLEFLRGQLAFFFLSIDGGPRAIYQLLVRWTFAILQLALIVRVILSWGHARLGAWYARWAFVLTEPILRLLRQFIPAIGMIDITPLVAWFLLGLLEGFFLKLM